MSKPSTFIGPTVLHGLPGLRQAFCHHVKWHKNTNEDLLTISAHTLTRLHTLRAECGLPSLQLANPRATSAFVAAISHVQLASALAVPAGPALPHPDFASLPSFGSPNQFHPSAPVFAKPRLPSLAIVDKERPLRPYSHFHSWHTYFADGSVSEYGVLGPPLCVRTRTNPVASPMVFAAFQAETHCHTMLPSNMQDLRDWFPQYLHRLSSHLGGTRSPLLKG
ncbi:hypothetical protein GWK47_017270 [Chionoecetes opilio]|uniref:Uncharacterized protein n=1 Tax=Chionoecetes opilio TaxID=41210 RepID=A0A8J5BYM0_CHIOP|nr:hypothetical protein GWK47_017270 [Chionoecetes opilio]